MSSPDEAAAAARAIGFPVVVKTDEPSIGHKSDVGGVVLGVTTAAAVAAAYRDLATRLGSRVVVSATAPEGVELALGVVRDPHLGPLVVVGAGGVLVEVLADRVVRLAPLDEEQAREGLARLARVGPARRRPRSRAHRPGRGGPGSGRALPSGRRPR